MRSSLSFLFFSFDLDTNVHTKPVNVEKSIDSKWQAMPIYTSKKSCVILFQDFAYPILHSSHSSKCEILTQHLLTIIFPTLDS